MSSIMFNFSSSSSTKIMKTCCYLFLTIGITVFIWFLYLTILSVYYILECLSWVTWNGERQCRPAEIARRPARTPSLLVPPGKDGGSQLLCVSGPGFPGGSAVKDPPANTGDVGSTPGLGRCPGEGNGYPFQYCCLRNAMDRGAWWARVHGVTKSRTQLSTSKSQLYHTLLWTRSASYSTSPPLRFTTCKVAVIKHAMLWPRPRWT